MTSYDDWLTTPPDEPDLICGACFSSQVGPPFVLECAPDECNTCELENCSYEMTAVHCLACGYIGPPGDPDDAREAAEDYMTNMKIDRRMEEEANA